jgi:zinc protease
LTAPGYRPEAYKQFVDSLDAYYAQQQHTLEGTLGKNGTVFSFLRSDEPRFGTPDHESLRKLTLDDLQAWMAQPLANGCMEVTIVGDVATEEALQLVAKTLGALPARAATKPDFKHEREVKFPTSKAKEFRYASATPRAAAVVCWPTGVGSDTARTRRISALADILNDRLRIKVREELGATYTPEVGATGNDVFPQFGYIAAVLTLEPDQVAKIGPLVATIAAELAQGPISDDEFDRALKPTLASLDSVALDNGYWLGTLNKCQESPEVLDAACGRISDWKSITKAELQAAAKEYLSAGSATVLSIVPSMTSE